jgi:exodeoxyribonuclease VII small subunit
MPANPKPAPTPEHTFETALARLEQIVDEMEGDRLPLEQLLERYGEGAGLLKVCQEKLEAAEKKIEIITRSGGKPQLAPFEPAAGSPSPAEQHETPRRAPAPDSGEISLF